MKIFKQWVKKYSKIISNERMTMKRMTMNRRMTIERSMKMSQMMSVRLVKHVAALNMVFPVVKIFQNH